MSGTGSLTIYPIETTVTVQSTGDVTVSPLETAVNIISGQGEQGETGEQGPAGPDGNIQIANDYATVRAYTPGDYGHVLVKGASGTVGGLSGIFAWDEDSTEDDNGGTILEPDAGGTGRWKRVYSGAIDIRWFGALGDGSTNDTAAIQAALDAAETADGGLVFVPAGEWLISLVAGTSGTTLSAFTGIGIPSGVELIGAGRDATTLKLHAATANAIGSGSSQLRAIMLASNSALRHLTVHGNDDALTIAHNHATSIVVTESAATGVQIEKVAVRHVRSLNLEGFGIRMQDARDWTVSDVEFEDIVGSGFAALGDWAAPSSTRGGYGTLSGIVATTCTWMGVTFFGVERVRAENLRLYSNSNGDTTVSGARGRGWNMEWCDDMHLLGVDTWDNNLRGGSLIGDQQRIRVENWISRNDGATPTNGAAMSFVGGTWDATGDTGYANDVRFVGCTLEPPSGRAHLFFAPPTANSASPRSAVIITTEGCNAPETWEHTSSNTTVNDRAIGTIDHRGVRIQKSVAIDRNLGSANWSRVNATVSSATGITGSKNGTVYLLQTTATSGRATTSSSWSTLSSITGGLWLLRGRVKPNSAAGEWSIGWRKASDGGFYREFRLLTFTPDLDDWFEFQVISEFDGTSTDYHPAIQSRVATTQEIYVDYLVADLIDGYGSV